MDERIREAIQSRLLKLLEGPAEMDAKQLRDCAAVIKETSTDGPAAEDGEEHGVVILPPVLKENDAEGVKVESES